MHQTSRGQERFSLLSLLLLVRFYAMLQNDKRRAIEMIVEQRCEEQSPEDAAGNDSVRWVFAWYGENGGRFSSGYGVGFCNRFDIAIRGRSVWATADPN